MSKQFMFDTTMFGDILDGEVDLDKIQDSNAEIWITDAQRTELKQCGDEKIRKKLLKIAEKVKDKEAGTPAVFGYSKWGNAVFQDGEVYEPVKAKLSGKKENNIRDAQIAQAAHMQDVTLVTADGEGGREGLQDALDEISQEYMSRKEFNRWLENE